MNRILLVEDEQHLANGLRFNLEAEGYEVEIVGDGEAALELLLQTPQPYDAVVLDVMLPDKNGFEVATELRAAGQFVPILMLTARGRPEDVLRGFEAGADDYLPKPFELSILLARLGGLLRRHAWSHQLNRQAQNDSASQSTELDGKVEAELAVFNFAGKTIDFGALELRAGGRTVQLTLMEADLLRFLVKHEGQAVSRRRLLEEVWGLRDDTDTRAIDNFIVRLRKYLEDEPSQPKHLLTVRGVGYRFVANPS
jgi:two-component system, OmpR family, alkaline phosphatase synthesis response regulator PhoP